MRLIHISLFLLLILFPSFVSSISTTMLSEYQKGETMIIEIQGNILEPIQQSDIIFKRNHVAIAANYEVKRIGDKYYLYAIAPSNENNYTLFINEISTTVNGVPMIIDYNQTFVVSSNLTDYSITPGFIITDKDFTINLKSNLDSPKTINVNFSNIGEITLQPGQNNVVFSVNSIQPGFHLIQIGKYSFPLFLTDSNIVPQKEYLLSVFPNTIRETILAEIPKSYNFTITNTGKRIENIYFTIDQNTFNILPETIPILEENQSANISISLKKLTGAISDNILINTENQIIANISFRILFTENETQVTNSSQPEYYCSELSGVFCSAEETCSGQTVPSLDGSCCVGSCAIEEKSSSSWIIYVLIIAIIVIGIVIYMKYKKTKLSPSNNNVPLASVVRRPI